jgi:hypothetical protein
MGRGAAFFPFSESDLMRLSIEGRNELERSLCRR